MANLDVPGVFAAAKALNAAAKAAITLQERTRINQYYPETGPLRRELYPKHMEFFKAGAKHRERAFIGGNRTGKSTAGAYETTVHLTGQYPKWWEGRRFKNPIKAWVVGETNKVTRDVLQEKLMGRPGEWGTGMIPGDAIIKATAKAGIPDAVDTVSVKHVSGGQSRISFKSYQEGRESFQGDAIDYCHMDEECPSAIYDEALMRLMTTGGLMVLSFTPLSGLSDIVLRFLPGGKQPDQEPL